MPAPSRTRQRCTATCRTRALRMNVNYIRMVRISVIYGAAAFVIFCFGSLLAWKLFPYPVGEDNLAKQMTWTSHILGEKIGSMILTCLLAFFAARAYRPTWRIGVITAVASAVMFQFISISVYWLRFGFDVYRIYHTFQDTAICTLALSFAFGFFAVWEQYRSEKNGVLNPRA